MRLRDSLPSDFDGADYCGESYWLWEARAKAYLLNADFKVLGGFYTIEGDSFGPLVRGIRVITPQKEKKVLSYG